MTTQLWGTPVPTPGATGTFASGPGLGPERGPDDSNQVVRTNSGRGERGSSLSGRPRWGQTASDSRDAGARTGNTGVEGPAGGAALGGPAAAVVHRNAGELHLRASPSARPRSR